MKKQEVFNKVAAHLLAQGKPALKGEDCVYRSKDGLKCAIGCLIPDENYTPEMERKSIDGLVNGGFKPLRGTGIRLGDTMRYMLSDLQLLHDEHVPKDWPWGLAKLAERYGVDYEPPA